MERSVRMICAAMVALAANGAALAAPDLPAPSIAGLARVQALAHPYDETADAHRSLAAALDAAKLSGKKVLVDFGANWCPDCRVLAGILAIEQVDAYVAAHYEVAVIDVGKFDRNLDVASAFGVKIRGIPTVLVIDPASGRVLNRDGLESLGNAASMAPQAVVDLLAAWTRPAG